MTLNQLICRAASVYPDAYVLEYWDMEKSAPRRNRNGGDTLAEFIARELHDTYNADARDGEQIATAVKVMLMAADDLQKVTQALSDLTVERMAA